MLDPAKSTIFLTCSRYASLPPEGFRDTIGLTKFKTEAEKARLKEVNRAEAISLANR